MTMNDFLVVGTGTLVLFGAFIIAQVVYRYRTEIVSIVSGQWRTSLERARAQKARRDRLYGYVESGFAEDDPGADTDADWAVLPRQHQAASELVPDFSTIKAYLIDHTLTDDEAIELLALARRSSGDDLLSANKIRDIVGGNEGKVKARVAAHRKPRPRPKGAPRLERPAKGWGYET
jgi:hypothetical protein